MVVIESGCMHWTYSSISKGTYVLLLFAFLSSLVISYNVLFDDIQLHPTPLTYIIPSLLTQIYIILKNKYIIHPIYSSMCGFH